MRQTLKEFGYNLSKVPLIYDNKSVIRMVDIPVDHGHTKHIDILYHFLRDHSCWGHASSPKVLQEQTPSANPFKRSAEATTHEASVL
jgi:hypothetical protein